MGDRANYAIREHGRVELFFGQWGANTLLADILWSPEACEAVIRSFPPAGTWLDDVFGEAGVAMCKDSRTVTFFDSRWTHDECNTAARLMEVLWPGWRVRVAPLVSGVAASLGVDLVSSALPSPGISASPEAFHKVLVSEDEVRSPFEVDSLTLIHWSHDGRRDVLVAPAWHLRWLLCGPRCLALFPKLATYGDVLESHRTLSDAGRPLPVLTRHNAIFLAVDETNRSLLVTIKEDVPGGVNALAALRQQLAPAWPGFEAIVRRGSAATHFEAIGERVPPSLLAAPSAVPLERQLESMAPRLLRSDVERKRIGAWLCAVEQELGVVLRTGKNDTNATSAPAELTSEERVERLVRAARALTASTTEITATRAESAIHRGLSRWPDRSDESASTFAAALKAAALEGADALYTATRSADGTIFGLLSDSTVRGGFVLVSWSDNDSPPRELCRLVGTMGDAERLYASPSGKALLVEFMPPTASEKHLVWVDTQKRSAKTIAELGPLARFIAAGRKYSKGRVFWSPDSRSVALEVLDEIAHPFGKGCVVVYDDEVGWVGEAMDAAVSRFDSGGLFLHRAVVTADDYAFEEFEWKPTDGALAAARMTGVSASSSDEIARRCAIIQSRRAFAAAKHASDESMTLRRALEAFDLDPLANDLFAFCTPLLVKLEQWTDLARISARRTELRPASSDGWYHLARARQKLDRLDEACDAAARCCELDPFWSEAHWLRACCLAAQGALDEGGRAVDEALAWEPFHEEGMAADAELLPLRGHRAMRGVDYRRCLLEAQRRAPSERLPILLEAIELVPERDEAYRPALAAADDLETRLSITTRWCASTATFDARLARIDTLIALERFAEAREDARAASSAQPDRYEPLIDLARVAVLNGNRDEARSFLRRGYETFVRVAEAARSEVVADFVVADGRFVDRLEGIDEFLEDDLLHQVARWDIERDLAEATRACALGDDSGDAHVARINALIELERLDEAREGLASATSRWPDRCHMLWARVAVRGGDAEETLRHLRRAHEAYQQSHERFYASFYDRLDSYAEFSDLDEEARNTVASWDDAIQQDGA